MDCTSIQAASSNVRWREEQVEPGRTGPDYVESREAEGIIIKEKDVCRLHPSCLSIKLSVLNASDEFIPNT